MVKHMLQNGAPTRLGRMMPNTFLSPYPNF